MFGKDAPSNFDLLYDVDLDNNQIGGCREIEAATTEDGDDVRQEAVSAQCGNFKIFVSLRFYVKSILWILEVQKLPFLPILVNFSLQKVQNA